MKYTFICIAFLSFLSCSSDIEEDCKEVDYGEEFLLRKDNTVCFNDGNSITLQLIESEICPCNAMCLWEGQVKVLLEISNEIDGSSDLISVGSVLYPDMEDIFENKRVQNFRINYLDPNYFPCSNNLDPSQVEIYLTIE